MGAQDAPASRAVDAELPADGDAVHRALLGDDERRVRVARMDQHWEAEVARETVLVEPLPAVTPIVGAVDAAVVLLPPALGPRRVDEQLVHALADLRVRVVGHEVGGDVLVLREPRLAAVVRPERTRCRDGDHDPVGVGRIELDRVAAHPAGAGLPALTRRVLEDALDRLEGLARVLRAEEDTRRATEPQLAGAIRMARADVPELLDLEAALLRQADLLGALPGLAAVGRSVQGRAVDHVRRARVERAVPGIGDRVHDLPAGQLRLLHLPLAPRVVAGQGEEPLARADENLHAHGHGS